MPDLFLDIYNHLAGIGLIPAPVQILGGDPELDHEIGREVLRLDFTPLLPPQAEKGSFIIAHNDAGVRAADKAAAEFLGVR
jgi:hypothetical protein